LYDDATRFIVETDTKEPGGVVLPELLGDIDVLVLDLKKRRIEVLEAKNHFMAKTPREVAAQRADLFEDGKEKSHTTKHGARIAWVETHMAEILAGNGIKDSTGWSVRGAIIMGCHHHGHHIAPYASQPD
jgi:hypothetical protein